MDEINQDTSPWGRAIQSLVASLTDPDNQKACDNCEGAGYLLTASGEHRECDICTDGKVLINNPFDLIALGGAIGSRK